MQTTKSPVSRHQVSEALKSGSRFIAPLWSLENFVAVNSYMGLADMPFEKAMKFMNKSAGTSGSFPVSFYLDALKKEQIKDEDLEMALRSTTGFESTSVDDFLHNVFIETKEDEARAQIYADVASENSGKKWNRFMVDRISFWASANFDHKQAVWDTASKESSLFTAWKQEAEIDFAPEVMGLKGFRKHILELPDNHLDAVALALDELEMPAELLDLYFNSLLMKMNGWAGVAARLDWDDALNSKTGDALQEFLAIMVVWDMTIKKTLNNPELNQHWQLTLDANLAQLEFEEKDTQLANQLVLQKAFDMAHQRSMVENINLQESTGQLNRSPKFQAIFCIDVRSEVLRRNIESVSSEIETLGFAGFFGFPIKYVPVGYEQGSRQCPVLLKPSYTIKEKINGSEVQLKAINKRLNAGLFQRAVKSFQKGAVSCFGFVSPLGVYYLPKLLSDSFGITKPVKNQADFGLSRKEVNNKGVDLTYEPLHKNLGIDFEDRVSLGYNALKAMSLTSNFASVVLITGHGSSSTNNPHASGLDCGACGGNSGEANARVAAAVLNNPAVRNGIREKGIDIPDSTVFIAALHDTTTDKVKLFNAESNFLTPDHKEEVRELQNILNKAGEKARAERALRMNLSTKNVDREIRKRSRDWSQVRPEWGLAGCSSFIVAPRSRTASLNLGGKAFLHNYSWQDDHDFTVLESIMTAPMVVTSWINLQYYASTVDNKVFGAGNKTLHNVVGGIGVLEGFGGDLKTGLPLQSVNDGKKFQHEPLRLKVFIEAPVDEMSKILSRNESIRNLCDNEWIYLYAINEQGKVAYKYVGNLEWEIINSR